LPVLDPARHAPSRQRPVRARARRMASSMEIRPHHHDWGQLVFSERGAVRVETQDGGRDHAFIVPPGRAVWIPPGVQHAVTAIQQADLRTVYIHADALPWPACRVMEASPLMRAVVQALADGDRPQTAPGADQAREAALTTLLLDEAQRARPVLLGLPLPQEPRLRRLCQALLDDPGRHTDLAGWATEVGASERTLHRLFKAELGTGFREWRAQLLLAHGLTLAARGQAMGAIAAELGYASASAFSAMVTRTVGMPPKRFFAQA
jgi:AraC-like DNA-binding protein